MTTPEGTPTPDELLQAYRTLDRLRPIVPLDLKGPDGESVWGGVAQARRYLAMATSWLGDEHDPAYGEAWDAMLGFDE